MARDTNLWDEIVFEAVNAVALAGRLNLKTAVEPKETKELKESEPVPQPSGFTRRVFPITRPTYALWTFTFLSAIQPPDD